MTSALFAGPHGFRVHTEDGAVSEARRRIVALVRAWDVPLAQETFGDLELLSSEVITNAVRSPRRRARWSCGGPAYGYASR